MSILIQYQTKRGAHISKRFDSMEKGGGGAEIERLFARRIKAKAFLVTDKGERGEKVGEVVDKQPQDNPRAKWSYFYDRTA